MMYALQFIITCTMYIGDKQLLFITGNYHRLFGGFSRLNEPDELIRHALNGTVLS